MKVQRILLLMLVIAELIVLLPAAKAELPTDPGDSAVAVALRTQDGLLYTRPTPAKRFHGYAFDTFGPYPFVAAAVAAGLDQAGRTPPEWRQGAAGYGKRFASEFGMAAVSTTTRYALAEALKEDTLYYRCECKGMLPRLRHAVISTVTARRGGDGHRVISIPAFVAPYAGTMAAVYGWYPSRFDARDAFRMGNYNLLGSVGGNIVMEFFYRQPHSLFHREHSNQAQGAPDAGLQR